MYGIMEELHGTYASFKKAPKKTSKRKFNNKQLYK